MTIKKLATELTLDRPGEFAGRKCRDGYVNGSENRDR